MVIVFNINESIVSLFADTGGEEALFDTIQTRAMDIRMDIGIPATIMLHSTFKYTYKILMDICKALLSYNDINSTCSIYMCKICI